MVAAFSGWLSRGWLSGQNRLRPVMLRSDCSRAATSAGLKRTLSRQSPKPVAGRRRVAINPALGDLLVDRAVRGD
jgi:hypothetical protein